MEITHTIPTRSRVLPTDPTSLTLTPITMRQELDAAKAAETKASGQAYALAFTYECVRRSVVKVDGKVVSWEGTGPEWMEKASQKVLSFAVRAYNKLHAPDQEEMNDFLGSGEAAV